ncbi:SIR2-like domain-containing protein [Sphingomonas sp. YR710]|nr:SIR2-like domain-containing protein [Sphingomonas sp. YR710]
MLRRFDFSVKYVFVFKQNEIPNARPGGATLRSNLKQHYLDDAKLAQLTWLEFARAMRTHRVIAFVGSMATEALGYGSWNDLLTAFIAAARDVVGELQLADDPSAAADLESDRKWAVQKIDDIANEGINDTVKMSLIEEVLESARIRRWRIGQEHFDWPLDTVQTPLQVLAQRFAVRFRGPTALATAAPVGHSAGMDVPRILFDDLDIGRFATTNYDFEIERKTFLRDHPVQTDGVVESPFAQLSKLRKGIDAAHGSEIFSWDLGSGRLRRVLAHGKAAESDLLNRERIDRLIEFAIGTDDVDTHVMHMHGRACDWDSMIVTRRDYDELYRRSDLNRLPFEFAKRLMTGGNPILFVGLGMNEDELNRELEEFISNKPYHRAAPAFLLWSAIPDALDEKQRHIKRLDWLHRLGVLTIFDTDLGSEEIRLAFEDATRKREIARKKGTKKGIPVKGPYISRPQQLYALALGASTLAKRLKHPLREDHCGGAWRETKPIITAADKTHPQLKKLWATYRPTRAKRPPQPPEDLVDAARKERMLCVLGSSGAGKGFIATGLAESLSDCSCLLINGGFSFDTDSMLNGIAHFLSNFLAKRNAAGESRSRFFGRLRQACKNAEGPVVHIILNGSERFFSITGRPLSAELDELMRMQIPNIRWVLFGTERIRSYALNRLGAREWRLRISHDDVSDFQKQNPDYALPRLPFRQMRFIAEGLAQSLIAQRDPRHLSSISSGDWRNLMAEIQSVDALAASHISGNTQNLREAFYDWALDNDVLAAAFGVDLEDRRGRETVKLAQEILRVLAFIGLPVEADVLARTPLLKGRRALKDAIRKLVEIGFVIRLAGFPYKRRPEYRYALHRSLLAELRYRFGIPLTEAKLSTAFNMSLYVAQPIDGFIPEPDIHDELGELMDRLMGSYREADGDTLQRVAERYELDRDQLSEWLKQAGAAAQACANLDEENEQLRIHRLCRTESVQCLRASLAVIRGYYSTTGILTLDTGDRLVRQDRDGILLEHAERLDRLIDAYAKTSLAREYLKAKFNRTFESDSRFDEIYGTGEPFYADELVWLHNERGVVCLAMGDLYEADASFERAMHVNRKYVEYDHRAHNWRRIRLNQLTVAIEMGDIGLTRRLAEEIISVSEVPLPAEEGLLPQEAELAIAIARGHLGWCSHLQGEYDRAEIQYRDAITALVDLEEVRAQAYFLRLRVNAFNRSKPGEDNHLEIEKALDLAQSTRQMDLVYRFQVSLADAYFFSPNSQDGGRQHPGNRRQRAHRLLEEAMQYALQTDIHRVRCEAAMTIARIRYVSGDYEGALRFATDALMVATRYGMELRKITLRADIARIMAARGDPVTAQKLALTAVNAASRQRFQTAIDRAERVLLDIPSLSAAIRSSDSSGRRKF